MSYLVDTLTSWLLSCEEGTIDFLPQAHRNEDQIPNTIKTLRLNRIKNYLTTPEVSRPWRPMIIEAPNYDRDQWAADFQSIKATDDPHAAKIKRDKALSKVPHDSILYVGYAVANDRVYANFSIDNNKIMLQYDNLLFYEMIPETLAQSLVGEPLERLFSHAVITQAKLRIKEFQVQPIQMFTIQRQKYIELAR